MGPVPPLPTPDRVLASMSFLNSSSGVLAMMALTALMIVITDWRFIVLGLEGQSILLSILATRDSPPEWALLRVITGGLIAIMWYLSARAAGWGRRPVPWLHWRWPLLSARGLLRLFMVIFVIALFLTYKPYLPLEGLDPDLAFLCTWLVVISLLALALSNEVLTAGVGLIWWLEAFHLYYPVLEHNAMVEGTMGVIKLLVGLACAYLIVAEGIGGYFSWRDYE